jgi:hypothetical protein
MVVAIAQQKHGLFVVGKSEGWPSFDESDK